MLYKRLIVLYVNDPARNQHGASASSVNGSRTFVNVDKTCITAMYSKGLPPARYYSPCTKPDWPSGMNQALGHNDTSQVRCKPIHPVSYDMHRLHLPPSTAPPSRTHAHIQRSPARIRNDVLRQRSVDPEQSLQVRTCERKRGRYSPARSILLRYES